MALSKTTLDVLARISDDWTDTTSAMLSVTVALVMRELNAPNRVTIALDADSIIKLIAENVIDRRYETIDGVQHMTITVEPRNDVQT